MDASAETKTEIVMATDVRTGDEIRIDGRNWLRVDRIDYSGRNISFHEATTGDWRWRPRDAEVTVRRAENIPTTSDQRANENDGGQGSTPDEQTDPRTALSDLIDAIDASGGFVDIECGQGGNGPVVRACRALGRTLPRNLAAWLKP